MPPSGAVPTPRALPRTNLHPSVSFPYPRTASFHLQTVTCLFRHTVIAENPSEVQWQSPRSKLAVTHSSCSEKILHTFVWFSPCHHRTVGVRGSTFSAWLQISVFWFVFCLHRPILCPLQSHAHCHLLPASRKYLLPPTEPCLQMVVIQLRLSPSAAISSSSCN